MLAVLLLATLLLATLLLLTRFLLATLLLLTGLRLPALLLLTTLLLTTLLARLLVWILIHSSFLSKFFPLQYWFATSIARFPWQESIRGQCIRSRIHIEAMCLELVPTFRVPLCNKENRRWDAICFCGCLGYRFRFWCSSGFLVVFTRRMVEAAMLPPSQGRAAIATRI